jgi:hypothetical protein
VVDIEISRQCLHRIFNAAPVRSWHFGRTVHRHQERAGCLEGIQTDNTSENRSVNLL